MDSIIREYKFNQIQILRGVAAIFVVYYHININNAQFGLFGVDIFFVLSGFIVSKLVNEKESHFFAKRLIKIIPPYYFATIALVVLVKYYPTLNINVFLTFESITKSLLFIPYHIGRSGPILSTGWTLNIEIFYYALISIGVIIFRQFKNLDWVLYLSILLMFFVNEFYFEFLLGNLIFKFNKSNNVIRGLENKILLVFSFMLPLIVLIYLDLNHLYFCRPIVWGALASILIWFYLKLNFVFHSLRLFKIFILIGNASYMIYIFHPFIIKALLIFMGGYLEQANFLLKIFFQILVVLIFGHFLHKYVEKPMNKAVRKLLGIA